jgi:hypothetical protein
MEEVQMDPEIRTATETCLSQWSDNLPMLPIQANLVGLQDAIHQPIPRCHGLGYNFFEGCIAKDWEQAQDAYYKWCSMAASESAQQLTTALIQKLWNVAWDLREHRNGIVHAAKNAEILNGMAETDNEIRAQLQQGPHGLQQRDHGLFTGPVNGIILEATIVYRQRWLQRVQTATRAQASTRRQAQTYSSERQALLAWLQGGIQGDNGGHEN